MREKSAPFASRLQLALIIMLLMSLILVAQQANKQVYQLGIVMLVINTILQIGASNVPPTADANKTGRIMLTAFGIVVIVFAVSILLTPYLIHLGRG